ncbi:hypothetical protein BRADI_1g00385v3 [Brachypodium distachyon]|uniref:Uncharacterized protein n=1 Tax=Brachypodium distachyon TaxID=15368 RepID=A0A2K2DHF8_BRADI|nr:hypothetical protein BRADI_1g00385v3 [Brachypodium distachyon]
MPAGTTGSLAWRHYRQQVCQYCWQPMWHPSADPSPVLPVANVPVLPAGVVLQRSCNKFWRIVERGFYPQHDIDNYSRREVVKAQLNSVALHMIQIAVGSKDLPYIIHLSTAKEAWESLAEIYVGNESMKRNK